MADVRVPIGTHFFTPDALQKALDKAVPSADLSDGHHGAAVATLDAEGAKVALIFTSRDDHWRIRTAYAWDWTGEHTLAGDILYRF